MYDKIHYKKKKKKKTRHVLLSLSQFPGGVPGSPAAETPERLGCGMVVGLFIPVTQ